jgi:hypothetical protein
MGGSPGGSASLSREPGRPGRLEGGSFMTPAHRGPKAPATQAHCSTRHWCSSMGAGHCPFLVTKAAPARSQRGVVRTE